MDVSPNQLVSVAAALIPFLENDDANRAPHGLEHAAPGGAAACAPRRRSSAPVWRRWSRATRASPSSRAVSGVVEQVDADAHRRQGRQAERPTDAIRASTSTTSSSTSARTRTRASTSGRSSVTGDRVTAGDVIADGPSTDMGESGPRPQRARRVHAVGRLQLRGLDPHLRAGREARPLHLDPHRGVRVRRARHEARTRKRSRATSRTSATRRSTTSTTPASSASAPR